MLQQSFGQKRRLVYWAFFTVALFAALGLGQSPAAAQSTTAPAGTSIGNQAAASYTDGSGVTRSVTSNQVTTVVQQVAAVSLTADNTKSATAGSQVVFPHTITNLGNGVDTFNLTASQPTSDNFNFTNVQIFADANGDGVPDNNTPITSTGPLNPPDASTPGQTFRFVVVGTLPTSVTVNQFGLITVTATSVFDSAVSDANTDRVNVTTNANINATLAISQPSGPPGTGPVTYTVTLTNNGNTAATNVVIDNGPDGIPAGMTYVANSGTINGVSVTDASGAEAGLPAGTTYNFNVTSPDTVTVVLPTLAPGGSALITYQVNVNANIPPQVLPETAFVDYFNGATQVTDAPSNTVNFTVTQVAGVIAGDDNTPTPASPVPQGATVSWTIPVTNTGNATDTFNMTLPTNNFPAGTTFQFFQSDGATPLQDTNGDGIPDTGPLATEDATPGGTDTYNVVVKAVLPPGASGTGPGGAPFTGT
ncbi:MAG: hypothetical protein M3347_02500, partial [Armatimonadota bacterium]|nr:hypothetical protein [Armatimonadota bacterium]